METKTESTRKKILYLVTHSEWGGAQVYVYNLALNLDPQRYVIALAVGEKEVASRQSWLKDLEKHGVKVWHLKRLIRSINPINDLLSFVEIYRLFKKTDPDIVHLNSSKAGVIGAVAAAFYKHIFDKKIKVIFTAHGFVFNEKLPWWRKKIYIWSQKIAAFFVDKIICVSEFDKISALNLHIANHKKFVTIHNGIDLKKINFIGQPEALKLLRNKVESLEEKDFIILTIANLYKNKGLDFLVKSAKTIVEKIPNVKFLIIGEGEERKRLSFLINKLKLKDNFFLLSTLPQASRYLLAADLFVLSSLKEGFPYTLLEALAAGLPIVATRVGGIVEIVEERENGLLVAPADQQALAKAILDLLEDEKLRQTMSINNKKRAPKFELINCIQETEKIYSL